MKLRPWRPVFVLLCSCLAASAQPILPDPKLTPGDALTNVTVEMLAQKGYANVLNGGVRNVPESEKRAVFIEYFGRVPVLPGSYEVDHLISLEIGGSNDIKNLWPQSYSGVWNAHIKDRLEDWMAADVRHALKNKGHDAATALLRLHQMEISHNWTNAYILYLGEPESKEPVK